MRDSPGPAPRDASGGVDVAVVLGPCDELRAEVYVRAAGRSAPGGMTGGLRVEGTLSGPQCRRALTLPVTARVVDLGAGPAPGPALGRVVLTEPSFWTPEVPSLYDLDIRLIDGGGEVATAVRRIGLRRLGVRGRSFWLDGRRWVPRAVGLAGATFDAATCRTRAAAALVVAPPDDLLARADEEGVAVVARLPDDESLANDLTGTTARLVGWAQHPSVAVAVVPRGWPTERVESLAAATRNVRGTLVLARAVSGAERPPVSFAGCDALVVELAPDAVPHGAWRAAPAGPLIASRPLPSGADVAAGRRACDRLQADLAAWGLTPETDRLPWDWAGYAAA